MLRSKSLPYTLSLTVLESSFSCAAVNECLGVNVCTNSSVCVDIKDSYRCDCKPGFTQTTLLTCTGKKSSLRGQSHCDEIFAFPRKLIFKNYNQGHTRKWYNEISHGESWKIMYLSCICHVFVMYLSCICHVFVMYLSCICHVFVMVVDSVRGESKNYR